jgi:hypothetical protein
MSEGTGGQERERRLETRVVARPLQGLAYHGEAPRASAKSVKGFEPGCDGQWCFMLEDNKEGGTWNQEKMQGRQALGVWPSPSIA